MGIRHLSKEKKEVVEEELTKAVQNYLKFNDHSGDNFVQAIKSLNEHLVNFYSILLVAAGMGIFYSLYLILRRSAYV